VAKENKSAPATVALAWLMARPGITAPIASATNLEQLHDLIAAASLKLDRASLDVLNQASETR
jgi:aryl-alcohol dehydrogenase-like predicted oxidoreductase